MGLAAMQFMEFQFMNWKKINIFFYILILDVGACLWDSEKPRKIMRNQDFILSLFLS